MIRVLLRSRFRGFRILDLAALTLVAVLALGVYAAKTFAGRERADIARVERDIVLEQKRTRLLEAEIAFLERPDRIGRLAGEHLGMAPVKADQEAGPEALAEIAARGPCP